MRTRVVLLAAIVSAMLVVSPAPALAWSNGGNAGNGFGTHDWVLTEAAQLAGNPAWLDVAGTLVVTDDPDTDVWDNPLHAFDRWGAVYGHAPSTINYYYNLAYNARRNDDSATASYALALLSHYYSDLCQPLHSDQIPLEYTMHVPYELAAQAHTNSPGENRDWIEDDGFQPVERVTLRAESAASFGHGSYPALVSNFSSFGENAVVMAITKRSLSRAVNDLADIVLTLNGVTPTGTPPGPSPMSALSVEGLAPRLAQANAWVSNPKPARRSKLTVSASVLDDRGAPVQGATVTFMWRHKSSTVFTTARTGSDGVARSTRNIGSSAAGFYVVVDATASDGTRVSTTSTGFTPK